VQSNKKGNLLVFGILSCIAESDLPQLKENDEVLSMRVLYKPEPLAFPIHEQVVKTYFEKYKV